MNRPPGAQLLGAGAAAGTESQWCAAAAAVLRRGGQPADDRSAWDLLARTTVERITIPPLGTPSRSGGAPPAGLPGAPPFTRGSTTATGISTGWDVRPLLADPDPVTAAAAALSDLQGGATSLWITVGAGGTALADLAPVLSRVHLDVAGVVVTARGDVGEISAARAFADLLATSGVRPAPCSNLGADPVGRAVRMGTAGAAGTAAGTTPGTTAGDTIDPAALAEIPPIAGLAGDLGVRALVVDATAAHEAGAGDAGELGYSLAVGAAYLRALTATGSTIDDALALLEFRYAATADQFLTIAKFRAARMAWYRVAQLSGATPAAAAQAQHAVTSRAMLTRYDPWVNILRATVAAFAAAAGGAQAVTVLPFDTALGIPDEFGRRLARNVSALLISESHVAAVADPAGGAHAVEMLTADLAAAGWAEFGRIEAAGGIVGALSDGSWRARVAATAAERRARIATRTQPITGVSDFPRAGETPLTRRDSAPANEIRDISWAGPFERLRDAPTQHPVFLCTLGRAASPRAAFCRNLFTAGGITIVEAPADSAAAGAGVAFRASGAEVAAVAGSDADYATHGAAAIADLRSAGAVRIVLAGPPPPQLAGLVDDHIAAGQDTLAFLVRTREQLAVTA